MALKNLATVLVLGIAMMIASHRANAALTYEAVDVPDTIVGVNRMKYTYHLDGAFTAFQGFTLIYDSMRYANLAGTTPLGAEWDQVIIQPGLPGTFDGLQFNTALANIVDATATFEVEFDWSGVGLPGPQPYEVFDDQFNLISASRTTPFAVVASVPEPDTLFLVLAGLLLLLRRGQRRSVPVLPGVRPQCSSVGVPIRVPLQSIFPCGSVTTL